MRNSMIIFKKQLKDTLRNKTILIQFILFPIMTLVMENAIQLDGMQDLFFTKLFSVMYIGMAPLTSVAAIISEEKEKNTLRVLLMANVKPWQYLLGVGVYVWTICMIGAGIMATGFRGKEIAVYLLVMGIGFLLSIACGSCIGIYVRNQMGATSISMPVMMVFSFLPMLAMFNERIQSAAKILYTQQLKLILDEMTFQKITMETGIILLINAGVMFALFCTAFRKKDWNK